MKKKICYVLLLIIGLYSYNVSADCSYKEQAALNSEVANIKFSYEEKEDVRKDETPSCEYSTGCDISYNYFNINILNMSKNFYIKVKNNVDKDSMVFTYDDSKDGIVTFPFMNINKLATFTFDIYTTEDTSCANKKIRTGKLTTPRLNTYSVSAICGLHQDHYLCQKYVTFEEMNIDEFTKKLNDDINKKNQTKETKKDTNTLLKNIKKIADEKKALVIIIALIIVISAVGTTYLVIKKRERN